MGKKTKQLRFVDHVLNYFGYRKEPNVALSQGSAFSIPAPSPYKQNTNLQAYEGWVYSCVRARSQDTGQIKLRLLRKNKDATVDEVTDHEVLSLLHNVNNFMTMRDLFEQTQIYKDLAGECFWYLVRAGNKAKSPIVEIWILRPDWIEIKTDPTKFITGYTYSVPGTGKIDIPVSDIIHHKEFNPNDPYRGLSIIRAAANTIDTENYAEQYNRKFFQNSALPSVVLQTEQKLDDTIIKRMRAHWNNEYGGIENAHKMAILEAGLDVKPFSLSQRDMEYLGGMGFSRDKIFAMFQVPKSRLGMTEGVTVSNAEATINIYIKNTIKPLMEKMRDALNEFLLPLYGDSTLAFSIEDPTPENKEVKLQVYQTLFNIGALSANEIRQQEGLDTVTGLDNYFVSSALVPVINLDPSASENDAQQPVKGVTKKLLPTYEGKNVGMFKRITGKLSDEITNQVVALITKHAKIVKKDQELPPSDIPLEAQGKFWDNHVEKALNFEHLYAAKVRDIFTAQRDQVIERAKSVVKAIEKDDISKILFNLSKENRIALEILLPILREYFEQAGQNAIDFVGSDVSFNLLSTTVRNFFSDRAVIGVQKMNRVSRYALRQLLAESVKNGDGIDVVTRKITELYEDFDRVRAERIARTEIMRAGNDATLEGYKQSGVVSGKQWYTAKDEFVCEWCAPLHGKIKSLDNDYFSQGEVFTGNKGGTINLDFEPIPAPPLHPNCRCTLIPIVLRARSVGQVETKNDTLEYDKEAIKESIRRELIPEIKAKVEQDIDNQIGEMINNL